MFFEVGEEVLFKHTFFSCFHSVHLVKSQELGVRSEEFTGGKTSLALQKSVCPETQNFILNNDLSDIRIKSRRKADF